MEAPMGLTIKQRVKVNAALSLIHANGYDAQTVVAWAKEYERTGYDPRRAFERALNDFGDSQPEVMAGMTKVTRLVEASDVATVAKYDGALSAYIATGDGSQLTALVPMMARDSVALAVKNGELADGSLSGASIEAALGFPMGEVSLAQAMDPTASQAAPAAPAAEPATAAPQAPAPAAARQSFAFASGDKTASQVSPFSAGRVADQARWDAAPNMGQAGPARGLLAGHRLADPAETSQS
jgi:hypothetical protein